MLTDLFTYDGLLAWGQNRGPDTGPMIMMSESYRAELQSIKLSDIRIKLYRCESIVAKDKGDGKTKILEIFPL